MLFSRENRNDVWFVLLGCLIIALVLGLLTGFVGSFWNGWFTPASWLLLGKSLAGVFVLCFVLAVLGLTEQIWCAGMLPLLVLASAFDGGEGEED